MKSFEQKLLGRLYCFCGGGDDGGFGRKMRRPQSRKAYDMGGGGYTGADDGFSDDGQLRRRRDTGGTEPGGDDNDAFEERE
jgi:hypothetical protein